MMQQQSLVLDVPSVPFLTVRAKLVPHMRPGERKVIRFNRSERFRLRKKKPVPVSEWCERHRVVPADSPIPGRWRNETTPYLAGIMDTVMFSSIQQVVVCAPPQTGKTDLSLNIVAYTADRRPGNWLICYPDEKTAIDMSKDRVKTMFEDSPRLKRFLTGFSDDLASLRLNLRHMRIYMSWANSAARLGARPLPYVLLDEIDKYPVTAGKKEASPIALAEKRTRTFGHMRKIIKVSTPTIEQGPVWRALNDECEAVFVYWVRCPDCGARQQMEFTSIKWEGGGKADAREVLRDHKSTWYECTACASHWDDAKRDAAVRAGAWCDREKGTGLQTYLRSFEPVMVGFHYRAWISRFVPLREAAAAFIRSRNDKTKLKDFQNDYNAEPWRVYEREKDESAIMLLRDDRPQGMVPSGGRVSCLTCGADTQKYGFWYEIRAWGYGMTAESWQVRFGFVDSFEALAKVMWEDGYKDADGKDYAVQLAVLDAMGEKTAEVYDFCRVNRRRILPFQGVDRLAAPFAYTVIDFYPGTKKPIPGGIKLLRGNVTLYKNLLANKIEVAPSDPGSWHMSAELSDEWARHMVSEYVDEKGLWQVKHGRANHGWDCSVYNLVAADVLGVKHWKNEPAETKQADVKPPQTPSGGLWVNRPGGWIGR